MLGEIGNAHWDHGMMDLEPALKRGKGRTLININMIDDSHRLFYTVHFPLFQSERRHTNSVVMYLKFEMEAIQSNLIFTALSRVHP